MLLDDRTVKPQVEDLVARFPRTPVWARRYQEALERGHFTSEERGELLGSYKSCLVGEAMGWGDLGFDDFYRAYRRINVDPQRFAPLLHVSHMAIQAINEDWLSTGLSRFEEALAAAQLL
jgi:hypothetical protein